MDTPLFETWLCLAPLCMASYHGVPCTSRVVHLWTALVCLSDMRHRSCGISNWLVLFLPNFRSLI